MMMPCAAGVDVVRDYFDVGLAPSGAGFRAENGPGGIAEIVARLRLAGVARVVLESIGGYATRLVRGLADAGFEVGVAMAKTRLTTIQSPDPGRSCLASVMWPFRRKSYNRRDRFIGRGRRRALDNRLGGA